MTRNLDLYGLIAAFVLVLTGPLAADPWVPLFDGQTLAGWTATNGQTPGQGWEVVDGVLHLNVADGRSGDIVTDREYENYELLFEWKISPGGNSGLKYRVKKFGKRTLGCEYQVLGDGDQRPGSKGSTGSLYEVYGPIESKPLKPVGQFNRSLVVVQGNRIEHWLNGTRIVEAEVGSEQWQQRIAESKFHDVEGFGEAQPGKIMLTDHGSEVWYRNVFLRPLPSTGQACAGCVVTSERSTRGLLRSHSRGRGLSSGRLRLMRCR